MIPVPATSARRRFQSTGETSAAPNRSAPPKTASENHTGERASQTGKRFAYDDHPGCNDDEADCEQGERRDRNTADDATHRSVRRSLNGDERADDHGESTQEYNA